MDREQLRLARFICLLVLNPQKAEKYADPDTRQTMLEGARGHLTDEQIEVLQGGNLGELCEFFIIEDAGERPFPDDP